MITQKNIKNEKGITLIVLVITIAIMIILAGATINLVVGEGGILDQVTQTEKVRNEQIAQSEVNTNNLIDQASEEMKGIWKDSSKANPPKLSKEMVPVKWNEEQKAWIVTNNKDSEWFDYSKKQWANVMLRDGLEVEGITNPSTETLANMNGKKVTKVGSMFVWIPRYAYQIESGYHTSTVGKINIEFMVGTTNMSVNGKTDWDNQSGEGNWNIHPAFEYSKTVEGIWVAKFEASSVQGNSNTEAGDDVTNKTLQIKPGVQSWRYISVENAFTVCWNYKEELNSHLIKNTEWGAVVYLAQSVYGKKDEIWTNPNSNYLTGQAGTGAVQSNITETYSYDNTTYGVQASTTGNIYGIYDMSGGAWETTASYLDNETGKSSLNSYGASLRDAPKYAKDVYIPSIEDTRRSNYLANKNKYGDAIWETSCLGINDEEENGYFTWYENFVDFSYNFYPTIYRGGQMNYNYTGAYTLGMESGINNGSYSFRVVLAP